MNAVARKTLMTTTINDCARCGATHASITVVPFTRAPECATHFAICPATAEPILVTMHAGEALVQASARSTDAVYWQRVRECASLVYLHYLTPPRVGLALPYLPHAGINTPDDYMVALLRGRG